MRQQRHGLGGIMRASWLDGTMVLYPGEFGRGEDYFVDGTNGNDGNNGLSWERPFATIQAGVDAVTQSGDRILVAPGDYTESVTTPQSTAGVNYVALIGVAPGGNDGSPNWFSGDGANEYNLQLNAIGWVVRGFNFRGPTNAACIRINNTVPLVDDVAFDSIIENNLFFGQITGLYGIDLYGSPHQVTIQDNEFEFFNDTAIVDTATPHASPYRIKILRNIFNENVNHIVLSCNASLIADNYFMPCVNIPVTMTLDIRGGTNGGNMVCGNFFGAPDFSNVGGYWPNAAANDAWIGNYSPDVAEGEVGDNGVVFLPPA